MGTKTIPSRQINGDILYSPKRSSFDNKSYDELVIKAVKIRLLEKMSCLLYEEGQEKLRKLLSWPYISTLDMQKKIFALAPDLKPIFFRILADEVAKAEKQLIG